MNLLQLSNWLITYQVMSRIKKWLSSGFLLGAKFWGIIKVESPNKVNISKVGRPSYVREVVMISNMLLSFDSPPLIQLNMALQPSLAHLQINC